MPDKPDDKKWRTKMEETALHTGTAQRRVIGEKTVTFNEVLIIEPNGATRTELELQGENDNGS